VLLCPVLPTTKHVEVILAEAAPASPAGCSFAKVG
jgi:hypothetical protein